MREIEKRDEHFIDNIMSVFNKFQKMMMPLEFKMNEEDAEAKR